MRASVPFCFWLLFSAFMLWRMTKHHTSLAPTLVEFAVGLASVALGTWIVAGGRYSGETRYHLVMMIGILAAVPVVVYTLWPGGFPGRKALVGWHIMAYAFLLAIVLARTTGGQTGVICEISLYGIYAVVASLWQEDSPYRFAMVLGVLFTGFASLASYLDNTKLGPFLLAGAAICFLLVILCYAGIASKASKR